MEKNKAKLKSNITLVLGESWLNRFYFAMLQEVGYISKDLYYAWVGESERAIQTTCLEYLARHRKIAVYWENDLCLTRAKKYGKTKHRPKGLADVCGMLQGGQMFAIEFKKPGGKAKPEQTLFLQRVKDGGGKTLLAFSLEDIKSWLSGLE